MQTWACDLGDNNPSTVAPAEQPQGIFYYLSSTKIAGITDGTSNTAFFSEKIRGTGTRDGDARSDSMVTGVPDHPGRYLPDLQDHEPADGHATDSCPGHELGHGRDVLHPVQPRLHAEHGNLRRPGLRQQQHGQHADGQVPPSSQHPGGVNTLFGDGSVKFIKNSVSLLTWRALGTRNGGETISADAY